MAHELIALQLLTVLLDQPSLSRLHRTAEVGFLFASAVTFVAYGTRAERSAEAGGLMMTYAYVAPFFVSAAFQARTCPQTCTVMGHVPPIDAPLFGPAAALGRW